jgi:hypothetical protein
VYIFALTRPNENFVVLCGKVRKLHGYMHTSTHTNQERVFVQRIFDVISIVRVRLKFAQTSVVCYIHARLERNEWATHTHTHTHTHTQYVHTYIKRDTRVGYLTYEIFSTERIKKKRIMEPTVYNMRVYSSYGLTRYMRKKGLLFFMVFIFYT